MKPLCCYLLAVMLGGFSARNDHIWARGWSANTSKLVYQAASIYGLYECNAQTQRAAN